MYREDAVMTEIEATLKLLSQYGAPLVITAGLLWFLFTRVPKWFDKSNESQERVAKAVESQSETMREHVEGMKTVMTRSGLHGKAGHKLATAAIKVANKYKIDSDIIDDLKAARGMLGPPDHQKDEDE
jgi:hypothetical protein